MISCIIPISLEDFKSGLMTRCEAFIEESKRRCNEEVEVITIINLPSFGRTKAKNFGASTAKGRTLVFLDSDCLISKNFFNEVSQKSKNEFFVGGGVKYVRLTRYSPGIVCSMLLLGLIMLFKEITLGAFWIRKTDFFALNGFREKKYDDIDFALRLKKYANKNGRKFESLKESFMIWSTRKYDTYGDWHWLKGYHVGEDLPQNIWK